MIWISGFHSYCIRSRENRAQAMKLKAQREKMDIASRYYDFFSEFMSPLIIEAICIPSDLRP